MSDLRERVVATKMSSNSFERLQPSAQLKEVKERANEEWRWRLSILVSVCDDRVCQERACAAQLLSIKLWGT